MKKPICAYLVNIDRDVYGDVDEVSKSQAGDEGVGSVPHTLVLVNNPQQGGITHHSHHKHSTGNDCVNILKIVLDGSGVLAGWRPLHSGIVIQQGFSGCGLETFMHIDFGGSKVLKDFLCSINVTYSNSGQDGH